MTKLKWKYFHETKKLPRMWRLGNLMIRRAITEHRPFEIYLSGSYITYRDNLDEAKRIGTLIHKG